LISEREAQRQAVWQHRLARAQAKLTELRRTEGRFPWLRLGGLLAGGLLTYIAFQLIVSPLEWLVALLAFAGFIFITLRHRKVIERVEQMETFEWLLQSHLARMLLDWDGIPAPAEINPGPDHPFAADLNITGARSLHQLLDTTASFGGSARLAGWLLDDEPDAARTLRRQELSASLLERAGLRLRLEVNGRLASPNQHERWNPEGVLRWLETHHAAGSLTPVLVVLSVLAVTNWILFALNAVGLLPPLWVVSFLIYFGIQAWKYRESSEVFQESYTLARQIGQLRIVLADLEDYPFPPGSDLAALCGPVCAPGQRPSAALRRIGLIASATSLHNNPFLSLALNILVPWDLFFADQLERAKQLLRGCLPTWLDAWYEIEALAALANYADHHPDAAIPVILPEGSQPIFDAAGLGHPLIPAAGRVSNDFSIRDLGEVVIITGSNMSGKSTFLRTVGVNLVLACAGGRVPARSLRALPFRLFTSMNLSDSLSDGISFFYAEVRRLKALLDRLDAPHPIPLLFLIDEIFRGTNNRERQLGSRAYTQALAGKHGAGIISTHDLELATLAENIPLVSNLHFREEVVGDQMVFDYKIHPGPSPTTNALRIMALAGLPTPITQP
jgi:hypothetical protein